VPVGLAGDVTHTELASDQIILTRTFRWHTVALRSRDPDTRIRGHYVDALPTIRGRWPLVGWR
jgi:hypothetical protein